MNYDRSIVTVFETAIDRNPYCGVCGAANTIRSDDAGVILECGAADEPRSLIARIVFALLPHERVRLLP